MSRVGWDGLHGIDSTSHVGEGLRELSIGFTCLHDASYVGTFIRSS